MLAGGGREKKFTDLQSQICSDQTQKTVEQASRVYQQHDTKYSVFAREYHQNLFLNQLKNKYLGIGLKESKRLFDFDKF